MSIRQSSILFAMIMGIGLTFGLLLGFSWAYLHPPEQVQAASRASGPAFQGADGDDYVIMVAREYAVNHDLALARNRLSRLNDKSINRRVEDIARSLVPQKDQTAVDVAFLAVALGSRDPLLIGGLSTPTLDPASLALLASNPVNNTPMITATTTLLPTRTRTSTPSATKRPATATSTKAPPSVTVRPTNAVTPTDTAAPTSSPTVTATATPTISVGAPTATRNPFSAPPALTQFYPPLNQIRNLQFTPVSVAPGEQYWHLTKLVYCDVNESRFGCPEMPGGPTGTNIYVMSGGANINAWKDGVNYGDRPDVIGDKKAPNDMCNCTYSFLTSNYTISVRGAPSDSIGGFCLCSSNGSGIMDGHAHVRFFLYFSLLRR